MTSDVFGSPPQFFCLEDPGWRGLVNLTSNPLNLAMIVQILAQHGDCQTPVLHVREDFGVTALDERIFTSGLCNYDCASFVEQFASLYRFNISRLDQKKASLDEFLFVEVM
jgi:hypothetical protein